MKYFQVFAYPSGRFYLFFFEDILRHCAYVLHKGEYSHGITAEEIGQLLGGN
jgi:hypothetical protein